MAWVVHKGKRFASKRKLTEYLHRLNNDTLQDQHIVQLHHGCTEYVSPATGRCYTSGHKIATAEFRGR